MTFSASVKTEILKLPPANRHCRVAMMSAIINGGAKINTAGGSQSLCLKTENRALASLFRDILAEDFGSASNIEYRGTTCYVTSDDPVKALNAAGLAQAKGGKHIDGLVTGRDCCRMKYLAGTFLACGYVSDPRKAHHCEFVLWDGGYAEELKRLCESFGLKPLTSLRKNRRGISVYFKDGEQISDILKIIGAHKSLMRFEDARIRKDVDNQINRSANFGAANVDKSISAAVRQMEDINLLINAAGLSGLPPQLAEIIQTRLDFPEVSLKELGEKIDPPVGKSGVNHRFRKIRELADEIRNN